MRPKRFQRPPSAHLLGLALAACLAAVAPAPAQPPAAAPVEPEATDVATLPPASPHRVWVVSVYGGSAQIIDGDTGAMLGTLHSASLGNFASAPAQKAAYVAETVWSRGNRGTRQDLLAIYDGSSLKLSAEVVLPGRAYWAPTPQTFVTSAKGGLGYVYNLEPASSVIVVDLLKQKVVRSVDIPGCAYIYPFGDQGFASLCGNGALSSVVLGGKDAVLTRGETFFDAENDPVFEESPSDPATGRAAFVTYSGRVHPAQLGPVPKVEPAWTLQEAAGLPAASSEAGLLAWRPGGRLAMTGHYGRNRLYVLMHAGETWTHKRAGTELWVVDLTARKVVRRQELTNPGVSVAVTQDERPLLFIVDEKGALSIRDADTLAELRKVDEVGFATLHVPKN